MDRVLPLLIDKARTARDAQQRNLRVAQLAWQQAQATLQKLQQFRVECLARSAAATGRPCDAQALVGYQRFLSRLDAAVAAQGADVKLREQRAQAEEARLVRLQQRLLALETLAQRRAAQKAERELRLEQRAADEFAALALLRRSQADT